MVSQPDGAHTDNPKVDIRIIKLLLKKKTDNKIYYCGFRYNPCKDGWNSTETTHFKLKNRQCFAEKYPRSSDFSKAEVKCSSLTVVLSTVAVGLFISVLLLDCQWHEQVAQRIMHCLLLPVFCCCPWARIFDHTDECARMCVQHRQPSYPSTLLENDAFVSDKSVKKKQHNSPNPHFSTSKGVLWCSVSGLGRERESLWCVMGFEILEKALKDQKEPKVGGGDAEMCIVLSIQSYLLPSHCLLISAALLCFVLTLAFFCSLFIAV